MLLPFPPSVLSLSSQGPDGEGGVRLYWERALAGIIGSPALYCIRQPLKKNASMVSELFLFLISFFPLDISTLPLLG